MKNKIIFLLIIFILTGCTNNKTINENENYYGCYDNDENYSICITNESDTDYINFLTNEEKNGIVVNDYLGYYCVHFYGDNDICYDKYNVSKKKLNSYNIEKEYVNIVDNSFNNHFSYDVKCSIDNDHLNCAIEGKKAILKLTKKNINDYEQHDENEIISKISEEDFEKWLNKRKSCISNSNDNFHLYDNSDNELDISEFNNRYKKVYKDIEEEYQLPEVKICVQYVQGFGGTITYESTTGIFYSERFTGDLK